MNDINDLILISLEEIVKMLKEIMHKLDEIEMMETEKKRSSF